METGTCFILAGEECHLRDKHRMNGMQAPIPLATEVRFIQCALKRETETERASWGAAMGSSGCFPFYVCVCALEGGPPAETLTEP
jgi:hypothetical protein